MRHIASVRNALIAAALLFGLSALLMSAILRQTEAAVASSHRYDIAWSGANARLELSNLARFTAAYLAFKDPADLEKVNLYFEIVDGRLDYLRSGTIGAFMMDSPARLKRLDDLETSIDKVRDFLFSLGEGENGLAVLQELEKAARLLDRIKNDAQASTVDKAQVLAADLHRKQLLQNILISGLLGSCILLLAFLAYQNKLLSRAHASSEKAGKEFAYMAGHDTLTGLPNRATLKQALSIVSADERWSEYIALLVIDLDGFKPINDTLGHMVGDELLISAAQRTKDAVSGSKDALVSRFGGDEFVVLLRGLQNASEATACAHRILARLKDPHEVSGHSLIVDASIGVGAAPVSSPQRGQLLHHADIALNEAKKQGKGKVVEFTQDMLEVLSGKAQIERDMSAALQNSEIVPHYQVQVELNTGKVVGLEALARWMHPIRGAIPPCEFIPVAEMSGQIVALGRNILRQACLDVSSLPGDVTVSVNVSAHQLFWDDFISFLQNTLRETGLAPARLRLEITETAMLNDAAKAREIITQLRAMGLSISLDDFGTGYSSLSYLRDFGFDELKIDRSFISAMEDDATSLSLVETIVSLGKRLGLDVMPEGIETKRQARLLSKMGCFRGQGYLFGKPMPLADVRVLLTPLERARLAS